MSTWFFSCFWIICFWLNTPSFNSQYQESDRFGGFKHPCLQSMDLAAVRHASVWQLTAGSCTQGLTWHSSSNVLVFFATAIQWQNQSQVSFGMNTIGKIKQYCKHLTFCRLKEIDWLKNVLKVCIGTDASFMTVEIPLVQGQLKGFTPRKHYTCLLWDPFLKLI